MTGDSRPNVVLTRPAHEAAQWAETLQAQGWRVTVLPLIRIAGPTDWAALDRFRQAWQSFDALMFVSAQAVCHFFPATGLAGLPAPNPSMRTPRFWAPGPGTAAMLQRFGVPAEWIDVPGPEAQQYDSEALWACVGSQVHAGHRLLIVRGESVEFEVIGTAGSTGSSGSGTGTGRDWLAQQCVQAGGGVEWCVAYRRTGPDWSQEEVARARRAAADGSLWLFSSSEAIGHLGRTLPGVDWSHARAVATHPRIAATARALGFSQVALSRPALPDVLHSLESQF